MLAPASSIEKHCEPPAPGPAFRMSLSFACRLDPAETRACSALAHSLSTPRLWAHSRLLAWVLLPDGWQALVEPGAFDPPALRLGRLARAAELAWSQSGRPLPLLTPDRQCEPLSAWMQPRDQARQLVSAPLRAGLVQRLGDYPYWDAVWLDAAGSGR